jgi:AGZA family xanthine/uracil permease-like MFS transporter
VLTTDGAISLIDCLLGSPFINAAYFGRRGWNTMRGRIGYSAATGLMVLAVVWLGIAAPIGALICKS